MFDFRSQYVYFRDGIIPFSEANISIANASFLYGLGVFSGIRAHYNTEQDQVYLFRPHDHFKRFANSAKLCQFTEFTKNFTAGTFTEMLKELIQKNDIHQDAYIRSTLFVDEENVAVKFNDYKDALAVFLYPLGDYVVTDGMKCKVSSWRRVEDNAIPSRGKMIGAYVNTAFSKTEALQHGYDEAIVLNEQGHAVEGSAENLFIVRDNVIITPPVTDNILEGITRNTVLQLAQDAGYKTVERSIDRTELFFADEVFLTGTGARVSPVTQIDHTTIGNGEVGPVVQTLQPLYNNVVYGKDDRYSDWLVPVYEH